jgi:succinate dehydrogenase/fumarate reductase flavoprotein subunit
VITELPESWDRVVDVVVVGSGSAALTAATLAHDGGSEVLVLEKAGMLGGTTAVSGGVAWLPGNHLGEAAGFPDSRDDALAYLRRLAAGREHDPALLEVFVDTAPEVLRYLEDHTPVRMQVVPNFPDYYFPYDIPGKRPGGRSVEPVPYPVGTELPEWRDRLATRGALLSLGAATTLGEDFSAPTPELQAELARREREDVRPKGAALVAMLFKGLLERGVEALVETPAKELVVVDGAVVGIRAERDGKDLLVGTRQGVVLACGGFEWNRELVRTFIGYGVQPLSPGDNTGDGLVMAMEAGAELANMGSYWGQPAMFDPDITRDGELVPQFEWARGEPSSLVVNRHGQRFANEAMPYNDFPKAFGTFDATGTDFPNDPPGWMVFDQQVRDRARVLSMLPGEPTPAWVPVADTIEELAGMIDVPAAALAATVERFNANAAAGEDPDFDRTKVGLMGPGRVAPLDHPPYYAVVIHPGALGTNGGPRLTADAQVRSQRGGVVEGLYAAGNTAASGFGWAYPSGGGTIGQALVVGYRAGRHVAGQPKRPLRGRAR